MQKVSKQSLAMIALSILLAISIALTFTFAALQDSKTATGTISFTGGFSLVEKGASSFAITPTYAADKVTYTVQDSIGFTLSTTETDLIVEISFTLTPEVSNNLGSEENKATDPVSLAKTGTYKVTFNSSTKSKDILVKNLLNVDESTIEDVEKITGELKYDVKITAKVVTTSSATEYAA